MVLERYYTVDADAPMTIQTSRDALIGGDRLAHRVHACLKHSRGGDPLTGGHVTGYFKRPDGYTVLLEGELLDGDHAAVVLVAECYQVPGWCQLVIRVADGEALTTVLAANMCVAVGTDGPYIDPEDLVPPSLDDLLREIGRMEAATAAAEKVAENVNGMIREAMMPVVHENDSQSARIGNLEAASSGSLYAESEISGVIDEVELPENVLPYVAVKIIQGRTLGNADEPFSSLTCRAICGRNAAGYEYQLLDLGEVMDTCFGGEMHSSRNAVDLIDLEHGYAVRATGMVDSSAAMDSFSHSSNTYGGYWICHILTEPRLRQASDPTVGGTRRIASGSGYPGYTGVRTTQNADYLTMYLADSDSGIDGSATKEQAEAAFRAYMAQNGIAVAYTLTTSEQMNIGVSGYVNRLDAVKLRMIGQGGEAVAVPVTMAVMEKLALSRTDLEDAILELADMIGGDMDG